MTHGCVARAEIIIIVIIVVIIIVLDSTSVLPRSMGP